MTKLRDDEPKLSLSLEKVSYMDMSGAKGLLTFIDHSHKSDVELDLKDLPPHVEHKLTALANDEQRDKLRTVVRNGRPTTAAEEA